MQKFVPLLFFCLSLRAQTVSINQTQAYIQLLKEMPKLSQTEQVVRMQSFLEENPDTPYREEMEQNLSVLNKLQVAINPESQEDKNDAELYFKAVAMSKTLPPFDRISLWKQFLQENPKTIYREEILTKIKVLQTKNPKKKLH